MAGNIFTPKKAFIKGDDGKLKQVDYEVKGQTDWDKYYYDVEEVDYLVPGESGDPEDFVKKTKIKVTKRSIEETINSQMDEVGLENCLAKFARTSDPSVLPSPVAATENVLDLTTMPEDMADYFKYIHGLAAAYENLPLELRKDMTMEEFTQKVVKGEIDVQGYLDSVKPIEKTLEKKEGEE